MGFQEIIQHSLAEKSLPASRFCAKLLHFLLKLAQISGFLLFFLDRTTYTMRYQAGQFNLFWCFAILKRVFTNNGICI